MAQFRRNIAEKIQIALNARLKAMNTFGKDNSLTHPILAAHNSDWANKDSFSLSREAVEAKSPFTRMIGIGDGSIDVIGGTFNQNITDKNATEVLNKGQQRPATSNLTGGPEAKYNLERGEDITVNRFGYKAPGITGLTCTFLDASSNGGAIRKTEITWTCWSMADIATYQKHSFLSMGAFIIVDWGWVRADKQHANTYPPPNFLTYDEAGKPELNKEMFDSGKTEDGERKVHPWASMSTDKYGDWDGVIGTVTNAQWALRDDGGIDCTTTVFSESESSLFSEPMIQEGSEEDGIEPFIPYTAESDTDLSYEEILNKFYDDLGKEIKDKAAAQDANAATPGGAVIADRSLQEKIKDKAKGLGLSMLQGPQLNLDARLNILDLEIIYKYFPEIWNPTYKMKGKKPNIPEHDSTDPLVKISRDKQIAIILYPYKLKDEDEFRSQAVITDERGLSQRNSEFRSEIWVTWGWFEDNVVSYYGSAGRKQGDKQVQFRSIKLPPPEGEDRVGSQEIKNSEHLYTHNRDFLIPGQTPIHWFPTQVQNGKDEKIDNPYRKLAKMINEDFEPFRPAGVDSRDSSNDVGHIRHLLISLDAIKHAFSYPGISIEKGMLNLAEMLNSDINLWHFDVGIHLNETINPENNQALIIPTTYYIKDTFTAPNPTSESTKSSPKHSYVFENYGMYSLIKSMDVQTNIGDMYQAQMTLARQKSVGPIGQLLGEKILPTEDAEKAYEVAQFFASQTSAETYKDYLKVILEPDALTNDISANKFYGSSYATGAVTPILKQDELSKRQHEWSHDIPPDVYKMAPNSRTKKIANVIDKMGNYAHQGNQEIDIESIKKGGITALEKEFAEMNMYAFPPAEGPLALSDEGSKQTVDVFLPYSTGFNMNPKYTRTLTWYLSENAITSLLRVSTSKGVTGLPVSTTLTLEGIGGLAIGDMFRLAYLPQDLYKQVRHNYSSEGKAEATDSEFNPGTYFVMWGIEHKITESGWETTITGKMQANFKEITKDDIMSEFGGGLRLEQALKQTMENSFKNVFKIGEKSIEKTHLNKQKKAKAVIPPPAAEDYGRLKGKESYLPGPFRNTPKE